jgi:hypothetical protein
MLLDAIKRAIALKKEKERIQAEQRKRELREKVCKDAPREIEKFLGAQVKLPPREQWVVEPFEESVCTQEGWVDLYLRVRIDDLELFAGVSFKESIVFLIRGQCPDCQEYLYYLAPLYKLEDLMHVLEKAKYGLHGSCSVCPAKIKLSKRSIEE